MDCILTNYPVSRDFQQQLSGVLASDVMRLSVTELRQMSPMRMLNYLRGLRVARLFLPLEDENGGALLPILKILAAFIPARETYIVSPDLQLTPTTRMDAVRSLAYLVLASAMSVFAVIRARAEVTKLSGFFRQDAAPISGRNGMYLNANLWFGVKAGGSVGHISGVVNALLKGGYNVDFVSAGGRLMVDQAAAYHQIVPAPHFGLPWEYNYYRFHFDVVKQLQPLVSAHKPDFIYQRLSIANYSGVKLSRQLGIPLILEYNGSEAWIARNWGRPLRQQKLAEAVEALNLEHASLIVTISDVLRDELLNRGIPAERIVTYPNCIDPEVFSPDRYSETELSDLRHRHNIPSDAVVVTFVGTFGQWHGADVLAKAIVRMIKTRLQWMSEKKLHFLLVGDGAKMPEVREILGEHAAGPFVTLAGLVPQAEAPLYLAASDILASPHVANADGSKFFGSPTKLFEYMAMGKAIVASDLDQIGEVLENSCHNNSMESFETADANGRVALLVKPGDVDDLIVGIERLAGQPELRAVLGRHSRVLALERYTWARHVEEILAGCDRLGLRKSVP